MEAYWHMEVIGVLVGGAQRAGVTVARAAVRAEGGWMTCGGYRGTCRQHGAERAAQRIIGDGTGGGGAEDGWAQRR